MDEVKKEFNQDKMDEKVFEKNGGEGLMVSDYIDLARELTGLVKDNRIKNYRE